MNLLLQIKYSVPWCNIRNQFGAVADYREFTEKAHAAGAREAVSRAGLRSRPADASGAGCMCLLRELTVTATAPNWFGYCTMAPNIYL